MDAALGKLLNSTIGTPDHKALDEIILGNVRLVASDTTLFVYDGEWTDEGETVYGYNHIGGTTSSFIQFDTSGTVRFTSIQKGYNSSGNQSYTLRVYDGSNNILASYTADIPHNATAEISVDVNVIAGSKYKFKITTSRSYSWLGASLKICATPVPNAYAYTT
jgi:hypothetical protein